MLTKKLSLDDFQAVAVSELLAIKGGDSGNERVGYCPPEVECDGNGNSLDGGGGGCQGDPDGFGGYLDQDEVVVYGTDYCSLRDIVYTS